MVEVIRLKASEQRRRVIWMLPMMKTPAIAWLLLLSACVICTAINDQEEFNTIVSGVRSLAKIVSEYRSEFGHQLKFVELQNAIEDVDKSMLGYGGAAKKRLDKVRNLKSASYLTYQKSAGQVLEWCVAINSTLNIFIPQIGSQSLAERDKTMIWKVMVDALRRSLDQTFVSLDTFTHFQEQRSSLQGELDAMGQDLRADFAPSGFYGNQAKSLEEALLKKQAWAMEVYNDMVAARKRLSSEDPYTITGVNTVLTTLWKYVLQNFYKERERLQGKSLDLHKLDSSLVAKVSNATQIAKQGLVVLDQDRNNMKALAEIISSAASQVRSLEKTGVPQRC
ncbi:hypothetical protein KR009_007138 [Drosophila setifemur]|nr:hypothetical protein KR009_007138 [Drosophila setifemur]